MNLFDGKMESELQKDITILVEVTPNGKVVSGTISQIGPADEVQIPSNFRVIDLSRKYAVPGLINAHCHLF